ncbi:hypothetical protein OG874_38220 [Nocardia sp. NBC_00565]|nr:hypothetical protein [Nocardia sp. NBC_00565]WUC02492.1 hypothetical protein OG874_38220 [Nocardia sp. NBC_00565]
MAQRQSARRSQRKQLDASTVLVQALTVLAAISASPLTVTVRNL